MRYDQTFDATCYPWSVISFNCYKFVGDRFVYCCKDSMGNVIYILVNIIIRLDFCLKLALDNSYLY